MEKGRERNDIMKEKWIEEAKEGAKMLAEFYVSDILDSAKRSDLDIEWFFDEVVNNMRRLFKEGEIN